MVKSGGVGRREQERGGGQDWKQISSLKLSTPPHVSAPAVGTGSRRALRSKLFFLKEAWKKKRREALAHRVWPTCAHTTAHFSERMDCKKKFQSTCAPRWESLRDREQGCWVTPSQLWASANFFLNLFSLLFNDYRYCSLIFLCSVHGVSRQVRGGLFARRAFLRGSSPVLVYGKESAQSFAASRRSTALKWEQKVRRVRADADSWTSAVVSHNFLHTCFCWLLSGFFMVPARPRGGGWGSSAASHLICTLNSADRGIQKMLAVQLDPYGKRCDQNARRQSH